MSLTWEEACHILGVPESATGAEIKERYLFLLQMLHPDKNIDKPEKVRLKAQDEFIRVKEAYEFLISNEPAGPEPPPKLSVVPLSIRFKDLGPGEKKCTTIEVASVGGAYTSFWADNAPAPWLRVTDIKSTTAEPLPLLVTIEATGMSEMDGQQRCALRIRLSNERSGLADEVAVDIEATLKVSVPRLRVRNGEVVFSNIPPFTRSHDILELENNGQATVQGRITTEAAWLSVSPDRFRVRGGSLARFNVQVDTEDRKSVV